MVGMQASVQIHKAGRQGLELFVNRTPEFFSFHEGATATYEFKDAWE
jgi:hypothetical protein